MHRLRRLAFDNRCWTVLLLSLALSIKLLVPAGYMTVAQGKTLTVQLCSGLGQPPVTLHIPVESDGSRDDGPQQQADSPCAFAGLGAQALAATDPVLLEAALLFAFVFALLAAPLRLARPSHHLRPPLRGPPALI